MREPEGSDLAGRRGVADPRVTRSRAAIEEAAIAHFSEHGYLGANLEDIAARAGVAKRTIYNLYGDKEMLFREIIAEAIRTAERYSSEVAASLGETDDVAAELTEAALELAQAVLAGRILPLRRLLIGEAARFPEFARDYYARAPGRVMATLASGLRRLGQRGLLDIDDPDVASEHLAFLVLGASLDRALFDDGSQPTPPSLVESRARVGVRVFLKAYAVEPPGTDGAT